ncbi:ferritin-like domain-containing protein [Zongyangia hominis]|uniref:Ferritin/DPS domain-containing protein n=1 Tax=Zongyangia hominis TaxID=2763677 RepID=A0A926ICF7_9FIRM|nr:ferritin-like domain-containing protein [Zongyangia hominis]MBC8571172.1 hypothetical protein [Zongyangia hominis]
MDEKNQKNMPVEAPRPVEPVSAPEPYPPIRVEKPNRRYAQMLSVDMASAKSEMTSITQYVYHSWVLHGTYGEAAHTLDRIAMVEMRHLDILGQLIVLLGGDPVYQSTRQNRRIVWNGAMVTYRKRFTQAIQDDIALEQAAIDLYTRQAAAILDPYVSTIIRRIIQDELIHLKIFRSLLEEYSG